MSDWHSHQLLPMRSMQMVDEPETTLTLPMIWKERPSGDATLSLGGIIDIGDVMFMPKANVWCALGCAITNHRSTGYADRATAMRAVEAAIKELENG